MAVYFPNAVAILLLIKIKAVNEKKDQKICLNYFLSFIADPASFVFLLICGIFNTGMESMSNVP